MLTVGTVQVRAAEAAELVLARVTKRAIVTRAAERSARSVVVGLWFHRHRRSK